MEQPSSYNQPLPLDPIDRLLLHDDYYTNDCIFDDGSQLTSDDIEAILSTPSEASPGCAFSPTSSASLASPPSIPYTLQPIGGYHGIYPLEPINLPITHQHPSTSRKHSSDSEESGYSGGSQGIKICGTQKNVPQSPQSQNSAQKCAPKRKVDIEDDVVSLFG